MGCTSSLGKGSGRSRVIYFDSVCRATKKNTPTQAKVRLEWAPANRGSSVPTGFYFAGLAPLAALAASFLAFFGVGVLPRPISGVPDFWHGFRAGFLIAFHSVLHTADTSGPSWSGATSEK